MEVTKWLKPSDNLDVAQTFAPRQLRKRHDAKLLGAAHAAHPGIARIPIHDAW